MSHKNTMKHMGKLYSLSHRINLSSDLLNTPDFYWDREELEKLFNKMCRFLSVARRTEVIAVDVCILVSVQGKEWCGHNCVCC